METGSEHPRLYRFGFLVSGQDQPPAQRPNENWRQDSFGEFSLLHHNEAEIRRFETSAGAALLLGWAFPIGDYSLETVVDQVISASQAEVAEALSRLSGRFCLLVKTADGTRAFMDPFGSQTLFYAPAVAGTFASHAELLAQHLGVAASAETQEFTQTEGFKHLTVKYLPGDTTMYSGIHCVIPNHDLRLEDGRCQRFWPTRGHQVRTLDEFFDRCDVYFESLARWLGKRPTFLGITGGIDTRFLLAGLAKHNLDLHGMTWLGGYHDPRERPVIEDMLGRIPMPHNYIEMPRPRDAIATVAGRNSGNARGPSRLTSAINAALPDMDQAVFVRGYGGEIIRGFYNLLKQPMRDDTPDEMFRMYVSKSKTDERGADFDNYVRRASADFVRIAGYDAGLAAKNYDVNDLFYWEQRMGNWAAGMHNEMDPAMLSITGLNDRVLYDLSFGLPANVRLKKSLFTKYIDRAEPRLSGLPIV